MRRARLTLATLAAPAIICLLTVPAASGKAAPNHLPDDPFTIPDNALHSATVTYTSNEPDGSTSTDTDTYDAKGRSIAATHKLTAADGTIRQWATESNEYNDAGQLVVEKQLQDPDGDGPIAPSSWITTTSYDKSGYATTKVTTFDKFSDGNQVTVSTVTFGTDRKGRVLTSRLDYDTDNDGTMDHTDTTATTYDAKGRPVRYESVSLSGTVVLVRSVQESTYDAAGREIATSTTVYDGSGDPTGRYSSSTTFDRKGNPAQSVTLIDNDGGGTVDRREVTTNSYDGNLFLGSVREGFDNPSSSTPSDSNRTVITYDAKANPILTESFADLDGDGRNDQTVRTTSYYDDKGRLTRSRNDYDSNGDELYETAQETLNTFDAKGRYATITNKVLSANFRQTMQQAYSYPDRSTTVETTTVDDGSDGSIEQTVVRTQTIA